jgi:hypothetical protein
METGTIALGLAYRRVRSSRIKWPGPRAPDTGEAFPHGTMAPDDEAGQMHQRSAARCVGKVV